MIHPYQTTRPRIAPSAFVHASAHVVGDVELGEDAGVWFCAIVRGDVNVIRVGRGTNIQDGTVPATVRREVPAADLDLIRRSAQSSIALMSDCMRGVD